MWPGVYGSGSSRKNLMASCDQSLRRTGLDYFDVFYSHRYDSSTPIEETMQALIDIVHQGKALYVGISKYPADKQQEAYDYLNRAHVPCLLSQYRCSLFDLKAKKDNFQIAAAGGSGIICFSPLAQGLLTGKYSNGIPTDSRAAKASGFLQVSQVTEERVFAAKKLDEIAKNRGQSLAQMALAWVLNDDRVTSVILGTSSVKQLESNIEAIENMNFSSEELIFIDEIDVLLPVHVERDLGCAEGFVLPDHVLNVACLHPEFASEIDVELDVGTENLGVAFLIVLVALCCIEVNQSLQLHAVLHSEFHSVCHLSLGR